MLEVEKYMKDWLVNVFFAFLVMTTIVVFFIGMILTITNSLWFGLIPFCVSVIAIGTMYWAKYD